IGNSANAHTINLGTSASATQLISIGGNATNGGSAAGTTIKLQGGATSERLANTGATFQTFTNSTTALQIKNSSAVPIATVDTTKGKFIRCTTAASGTVNQGTLVLSDGTTDNFGATVQTTGSLSGNSTFQLGVGSANGTYQICTTLSICSGYAPSAT